jgi:hypothetical protein
MYVVDIITGTGCVARDSVQSVNGDLWFLSRTGVQSLGRLIQQKNNPIFNLSRNVQDDVKHFLDQMTSVASLRSVYSPANKLYLLSFPVSGSTGGAIAFDTRGLLEDGSARCMGLWTLIPTALCRTFDDTILSAIDGQTGYVGAYSGASDNGAEYLFTYESAWLDLTDRSGYLLIAKRLAGTFFTDTSISLIFKWAFDFTESFYTYSTNLDGPGDLAEFGIAEFGIAEFGGGTALRTSKIPASGTGQYIRLGIDAPINGQTFSVQQLNVFCKIGRYA